MLKREGASNPAGQNHHVQSERSDASFTAVLIVIGALLLLAVLMVIGVHFFFHGYQGYLAIEGRPTSPLSPGPSPALPPEPRLEQMDRLSNTTPPSSTVDLQQYGPTREKGFVRVPIDRAIEHLQGKLPSRPAPEPEQVRRSSGLVDAGEPNSGRKFKKGER